MSVATEHGVEWWETFDGILNRLRELKVENDALRAEIETLKLIKPCTCKSKKEKKNEGYDDVQGSNQASSGD